MKLTKESLLVCLILILISGVIGFFIGRSNEKVITKTKIEYIKGDTVKVLTEVPVPISPSNPRSIDTLALLAYCKSHALYKEYFISDTIKIIVPDTSSIVTDWAMRYDYEQRLIDNDSLGTVDIKTYTQYNRLGPIEVCHVPIHKVVTNEVLKKRVEPFIGMGVTTCPSILGQVGLYFKSDWGVSILYQYDANLKSNNFGFMLNKKF